MCISYWSSDVFSSDLVCRRFDSYFRHHPLFPEAPGFARICPDLPVQQGVTRSPAPVIARICPDSPVCTPQNFPTQWGHGEHQAQRFRLSRPGVREGRSEEHTYELQSLMRISYAVFCLKKKKN